VADQTGMDADGRVNFRIGRSTRHGAPGGQTGHEHALRIDIVCGDDFVGDPGDDRRFAATSHLILRLEPVPAQGWICALALAWIGNEKSMLLG